MFSKTKILETLHSAAIFLHCCQVPACASIFRKITELCHCFLAELASLLIRNVTYEGPALRKQLAKAQQLQQELSRREVECQSSAADMRERYYAACKQYSIRVSTGTSTWDSKKNLP